jgi:hypothetical protein
LVRFRSDTTAVRVLFYFKRTAQDPFTLDLTQISQVREFRESLGPEGVLYQDFRDTAEFVELIRKNLHHLIVDEWLDGHWIKVDLIAEKASGTLETPKSFDCSLAPQNGFDGGIDLEKDDGEELGFLELVWEFQRAAEALTPILARIGEHTTAIGELFKLRTDQVNNLLAVRQVDHVAGNKAGQEYTATLRDFVDQAATDLDKYSADIAPDLQLFKIENRTMFEHLSRVVDAQQELPMPAARLQDDRRALKDLIRILLGAQTHVIAFQASVSGMPALTIRLKKARKRASATLGEMIAELQFAIQAGNRILEKIPGNDSDTVSSKPTA